MRLIIFSSQGDIPNEHAILNALFKEGLDCFHLRKPGFTEKQIHDFLGAVAVLHRDKIVLHGAKGEERRTRGLHSLSELEQCRNKGYSYVFLSPVFDSISKQGYKSSFEHPELKKQLLKMKETPGLPEVIALGGIDEHNIVAAMDMGFDGIAVLGALWNEVVENDEAKSIKRIFEKYRRMQSKVLTPRQQSF